MLTALLLREVGDFMNLESILVNMDLAFKQDRERFFAVADTLHLQPAYAEYLDELEALKQEWRDLPNVEGYPVFSHPLALPEWFPSVKFASCFDGQNFIDECLGVEKKEVDDEDVGSVD